jgi:hypothetical protein
MLPPMPPPPCHVYQECQLDKKDTLGKCADVYDTNNDNMFDFIDIIRLMYNKGTTSKPIAIEIFSILTGEQALC